jgi:hypothetical protein
MSAARCLLFSHHIEARAKLKAIAKLADNNVSGVFRVGKPGYVFISGDATHVQASVKSLKVRAQVWGSGLMHRRISDGNISLFVYWKITFLIPR